VETAGRPRAAVVVAIDGPSGTGKSSTSRGVASALGLRYLDTGAQYRAVTWWMLSNQIDVSDAAAVATAAAKPVLISGTDPKAPTISVDGVDASGPIRTPEVTAAVSAVAAVPEVRTRLYELQRATAAEAAAHGGIVVEGRDIGTTVLPGATVKIFLTASPEARAERRNGELRGAHAVGVEATREDLIRRDTLDSGRTASPLAKAEDAVEVDTTELTLDQVVETIVALVEAERPGPLLPDVGQGGRAGG
jgi:CMP/dCMP kinase